MCSSSLNTRRRVARLSTASRTNLFVRRVRFLVGVTLFKNIEFFFDTDYPDLFKGTPTEGTKNTPGLNVQDAFGTVKLAEDAFKIDMGYMLPPSTHNANQSAATLYSWDYFSNSFRNSASFNSSGNPVGRDAGVQVRGLVLDNHLEYRAGLFQGRRNDSSPESVQARNFFRVAGRLQVNVFDPETGFFYAGSYLGAKKIAFVRRHHRLPGRLHRTGALTPSSTIPSVRVC